MLHSGAKSRLLDTLVQVTDASSTTTQKADDCDREVTCGCQVLLCNKACRCNAILTCNQLESWDMHVGLQYQRVPYPLHIYISIRSAAGSWSNPFKMPTYLTFGFSRQVSNCQLC